MSLNNYYMPPENRKRQKVYTRLEYVNQFLNNYVLHENKIRKNKNLKNFLQNAKQEFPCQSLESFSGE